MDQPGTLTSIKNGFAEYLGFVNEHVQKLEYFLEEEKISSLRIAERIMNAFIDAANEKMNYCTDTEIKDACLLACIQVINHFKMVLLTSMDIVYISPSFLPAELLIFRMYVA